MSNPFTTKGKPLPTVSGLDQIVYEGVRALEALRALVQGLGEDAGVSEIQIWENTPITASIFDGLVHEDYGWNFDGWVKVGF